MRELLAVIDAPHMFAGIVLRHDRVIEAADIVRYMKGWSRDRVRSYCAHKGWKVSVVTETRVQHTSTPRPQHTMAEIAAVVDPIL